MAGEDEIKKTQEERKTMEKKLASLNSVIYDVDIYGSNRPEVESIPVDEDDENAAEMDIDVRRKLPSYTAPKSILKEMLGVGGGDDANDGFRRPQKIIDRESDYLRRRFNRKLSPERNDPFVSGDKTPDVNVRTYAEVMREEILKRDMEDTLRLIAKKKKAEEESKKKAKESQPASKRRNRWEQSQDQGEGKAVVKKARIASSDWDLPDSAPGIGRWDATPTSGRVGGATFSARRNRWDETPTPGRLNDSESDATPTAGGVTPVATPSGMTWDSTPKLSGGVTPMLKKQSLRWDKTPAAMGSATPMGG